MLRRLKPASSRSKAKHGSRSSQSLLRRSPARPLTGTDQKPPLGSHVYSNLRDAQTDTKDRPKTILGLKDIPVSAPKTAYQRRPRIPSIYPQCQTTKKARVTALPCATTRSVADADRAYTQPYAWCQILYGNYFKSAELRIIDIFRIFRNIPPRAQKFSEQCAAAPRHRPVIGSNGPGTAPRPAEKIGPPRTFAAPAIVIFTKFSPYPRRLLGP